MTAVMWALTALRRVPRDVWFLVAGVALIVAGYAAVVRYGAANYARGKRDAAAGVVFDSVTLARAAERVAKASAHTDTVTQRVLVTRYRVDTLITQLPPEVADVPEVKALVTTVHTLTMLTDSITTAHTAERAAWTEKARVDSSAIYALRIIGTAQRDTIMTLTKRPKWRTVVVGTLAGIATGFVAGVVK
jgi:hypothetical protein